MGIFRKIMVIYWNYAVGYALIIRVSGQILKGNQKWVEMRNSGQPTTDRLNTVKCALFFQRDWNIEGIGLAWNFVGHWESQVSEVGIWESIAKRVEHSLRALIHCEVPVRLASHVVISVRWNHVVARIPRVRQASGWIRVGAACQCQHLLRVNWK